MAYTGVIIAFDLAGNTGVCEGCPGEKPLFQHRLFNKEHNDLLDTCAVAMKFVMDRIASERWIAGRLYGRGEAAEAGLVRVVIEAPIEVPMKGKRNNHSHGISLGLFAAVGGIARARGVMVSKVAVRTVRAHFIGKGNLPGDQSKRQARAMCEALGWQPPSLDCADAGAVWHYFSNAWNADATPSVKPLHHRVCEVR